MGRQKELLAIHTDLLEWAEDNYDEEIGEPESESWKKALNALDRYREEELGLSQQRYQTHHRK